jgi:hypothetical protein
VRLGQVNILIVERCWCKPGRKMQGFVALFNSKQCECLTRSCDCFSIMTCCGGIHGVSLNLGYTTPKCGAFGLSTRQPYRTWTFSFEPPLLLSIPLRQTSRVLCQQRMADTKRRLPKQSGQTLTLVNDFMPCGLCC